MSSPDKDKATGTNPTPLPHSAWNPSEARSGLPSADSGAQQSPGSRAAGSPGQPPAVRAEGEVLLVLLSLWEDAVAKPHQLAEKFKGTRKAMRNLIHSLTRLFLKGISNWQAEVPINCGRVCPLLQRHKPRALRRAYRHPAARVPRTHAAAQAPLSEVATWTSPLASIPATCGLNLETMAPIWCSGRTRVREEEVKLQGLVLENPHACGQPTGLATNQQ